MKEEIRSNLRKLIAYEIGIWSYKKIYDDQNKTIYIENLKKYYNNNPKRQKTLVTAYESTQECLKIKKDYIDDVLEKLYQMYFNTEYGIKNSMPQLNRFYRGDPRDKDYDLDKIDELYESWVGS
jgi:hypothetical protein